MTDNVVFFTAWITLKEAAEVAKMPESTFAWWVNQGRGPKVYEVLHQRAFIPSEVVAWRPEKKPTGGDRRSQKATEHPKGYDSGKDCASKP
jgi:hypothetical protein